jgi:hypothetical protein
VAAIPPEQPGGTQETQGQANQERPDAAVDADQTLNYLTDELVSAVLRLTGGAGIDRVIDECLSQHWFASLSPMRSVIDNWRDDYNHHRSHSTLGCVLPATFAPKCRQLAGATSQPSASTTMQISGL